MTSISSPAEVVFIDSRVKDSSTLLQGVSPNAQVVYLDAHSDGLAQMADYLAKNPGAAAIHVVSHGAVGNLWLGNSFLDAASLQTHAQALAGIGAGMKAGGDILIYSCDLAAGEQGKSFVGTLAALTGADVAASTNRTGAGGDWQLEISTGTIEAPTVFSQKALDAYALSLSTVTVTSNADSGAGSLRDAITSANTGDTITFSTGMTITLSTGQLSINKNLTIDGDLNNDGTADVTLDANYSSRVLNVASGTVTLDGLTFTHGLLSGAGGASNRNGSIGGDALGAAIYNAGTLTILGSTITGNVATGGGGGGGGDNGTVWGGYAGGGGSGFNNVGGAAGGSATGFYSGTTNTFSGATGGGGAGGGGAGGGSGYLAPSGSTGGLTWDGGARVGGNGGTSAGGGAGGTPTGLNLGPWRTGGDGGSAGASGGGGGGSGYNGVGNGGDGGSAVGGIYNAGTLNIARTTFLNNLGSGGGGGGAGQDGGTSGSGGVGAGAIWNAGGSSLLYQSSTTTFTGNVGGIGGNGGNTAASNPGLAGPNNIYGTILSSTWSPAPTVTDSKITISSGSGTGGAYKIGDTVTATWNNTAGGDNNTGVTGVTVNFTQFGGGAAVAATNSSGTWSASYTIVAGGIDATNRNVSVTASNATGSTTTSDSTNASVDNIAPSLTDARIAISGASGTGSTFRIGDTVTATWNNTAAGDNNSDTISAVTVDFSQFGGSSAATATNNAGTWTATYAITAGAIEATNRNVSVTVTDNAGNTATTADTTNAAVDNIAPTITFSGMALSADTGASSSDFTTNIASQTISANLSAGLGAGDIVYGSVDNGASWIDITTKVSGTTLAWNGAILSGSSTLKLKVTDSAGNDGTVASKGYVLDTGAPTITFSGLALSSDSGTSSSDFTTNTAAQTISATLSAGLDAGDIVYGSLNNGAIWTNITAKVSGTTLTWDGVTLSGSDTLKLKVTDSAGNDSAVASKAYVLDTGAPAITFSALALSADTGTSSTDFITSTASQTISATLSAGLDAGDIVYGSVDNGATWTNITAKVSGTTLTWDGVTLAGSNTLKLKVTDSAGNDSAVASKAYVLDTTAPTVTSVTVPANGSYKAGQSLQFTLNLSESVTVTGTDSILILDVGGVVRQATYLSDTANSVSYCYTIQAGENDSDGITVVALTLNSTTVRDAIGNDLNTTLNSIGSTAAVLVDTTAPGAPSTLALAAGSDSGASNADRITNDTTPTITGLSEASATVALYDSDGTTVLGTATADGAGNWSITSSTLAAGTHTLTAKATDAAGNTGTASGGLAITIDTGAPAAPAITAVSTDTGTAGDRITSDNTLVLSGTAEANSTVTVSRSGVGAIGTVTADGTGNWSYNYTGTTLADGSYTFTATATDVAGNAGAASTGFTVTVDTTAPSAPSTPDLAIASDTGSSGTDNVTYVTTPVITGTAETGATVTLYDTDGTTVLGTAVATGGNWSITASTLAAGAHTLTAKATDAAGNTGVASSGLALTIDTGAPAAPAALTLATASDSGASNADRITSVTTPVITGTAEAGATVTLYDADGTTVLGTAVATGGNWSITASTLTAGSHTLKAKASDAAGNLSAASAGVLVNIDTSAPQLNSASVTGVTLTLGFNESVDASTLGGMAVTVNGTLRTIASVAGSGTSTLTLTLASAVDYGQTVTFGYDPAAPLSTLADMAGNEAASIVAHTVTNAAPAPDAGSTTDSTTRSLPDSLTDRFNSLLTGGIYQGVTANTTFSTDGYSRESLVMIVSTAFGTASDGISAPDVFDVPLSWDTLGYVTSFLNASLPVGLGMTVIGSGTPQSSGTLSLDLARQIIARTQSGSPDQSALTNAAAAYLQELPANLQVLVKTIVPSVTPNADAPAAPLVISGTPAAPGTPMTALVIDAHSLPAGSTIQLQNVDFAALVGSVSVTGGAGSQHVWGDSASQTIFLGADDDELHGGGGNDTVGSAGGNDRLFGDDGNDTLFGGAGQDLIAGGAGNDTVVYTGSRADYKIERNGKIVTVRSLADPTDADTLVNVETIKFGDATLTLADDAAPATTAQVITGLYAALYGRAPDSAGLQYWLQQVNEAGTSLHQVATQFSKVAKFDQLYAPTLANADFVAKIYQNILGIEGDAAGRAYWTKQIDHGLSRTDFVGDLVYAVLQFNPATSTATGADLANATLAKNALADKVQVGLHYAAALAGKSNGAVDSAAYQQSVEVLNGVDATSASIENAVVKIDLIGGHTGFGSAVAPAAIYA